VSVQAHENEEEKDRHQGVSVEIEIVVLVGFVTVCRQDRKANAGGEDGRNKEQTESDISCERSGFNQAENREGVHQDACGPKYVISRT
jgi:hypothetical protein